MSRRTARTAARRSVRPVEVVSSPPPPSLAEITEDAFHRARAASTAHTNTLAGETFTAADATFVRVNGRHFRIEGALDHGESLAVLGRSPLWRQEGQVR